jgi:flagellar basal body P-ring formation protein FlgA
MRWIAVLLMMPGTALAESLIATRMILPMTVISAEDMTLVDAEIPGALNDPFAVIGLEARVTIYPGRPIHATDIGHPTLIDRNQIVPLRYATGGLAIVTEGRALARGAQGDVIRVMNMASRSTVSGRIMADGSVIVGDQTEG